MFRTTSTGCVLARYSRSDGPQDVGGMREGSLAALEINQRKQGKPGFAQTGGAAEFGQIHNGRALGDNRAQPFQQPAPRHHGAAGGDQIVNQHHLVAGTHSVGVQFHRSASIFQFMGFGDSIERQLDLARCVLELGKP